MAKKDNVRKIKSYIDDILGTKSSLRQKLPSKKLRERDLFCHILQNLQFVNNRTLGLKHDYKINMMDYDDPFYSAIENLIKYMCNHLVEHEIWIKIHRLGYILYI